MKGKANELFISRSRQQTSLIFFFFFFKKKKKKCHFCLPTNLFFKTKILLTPQKYERKKILIPPKSQENSEVA